MRPLNDNLSRLEFDLSRIQKAFTLKLAELYALQCFDHIPRKGEETLLPVESAVLLFRAVSEEVRVSAIRFRVSTVPLTPLLPGIRIGFHSVRHRGDAFSLPSSSSLGAPML
jgi:hypothetical protein